MTMTGAEVLRAFIDALSQLKTTGQSRLWPGTVIAYDSFRNVAFVKVDGSSLPVPMVSQIGALTDGQRVQVEFDPPHGAYVTADGTTGGSGGGGGVPGGGLTAEQVEDLLGYTFIQQGPNIRIVYDDAVGTLTFSVTVLDVDLDFGGHKGINAADPTDPQDVATKAYVDAHASPSDLAFPFFMAT